MKFGKELLRAVDASESVVSADNWLDYKVLKKMLKKMPPTNESDNQLSEAEKIIKSEVEREFFRALSRELVKVETRFTELKSRSLQLADEFSSPSTLSVVPGRPLAEIQERLTKCAAAHLFVLLVENYAVLNYCGFTKILKKHDKLRATNTKIKFMSKMVNDRNFAKFDEVRGALRKLEHAFAFLTKASAEEKQRSSDSPSGSSSSASAAVAGTASATYDAQWRELVDINHQSMDRLKSLANTVLSLEENENSSDDTSDDPNPVVGERPANHAKPPTSKRIRTAAS